MCFCYQLPQTSTSVNVFATGKGIALVQLNVNYNVYATPSKPGINLTLVTQTDGDKINLQSCGRLFHNDIIQRIIVISYMHKIILISFYFELLIAHKQKD